MADQHISPIKCIECNSFITPHNGKSLMMAAGGDHFIILLYGGMPLTVQKAYLLANSLMVALYEEVRSDSRRRNIVVEKAARKH